MMRMEPNVVLKYFSPLDEFVKVRLFTLAEAEELLRFQRAPTKRQFQQLVINACVVHYNDTVLPLFDTLPLERRATFEDDLYRLCVEANPALDLATVTLSPGDEPKGELHLLAGPAAAPPVEARLPVRDLEEVLARRVIGQEEA